MYCPHYYKAPIRHLFRGGTNAIKSTAETVHRRETTHLSTPKEELGRYRARITDPTHVAVSLNTPRIGKKAATTTTAANCWFVSVLEVVSQVACPGPRTSPADSDGCTLGMGLTSDRVASAVHVAVLMVVQVAVSAAEMLPVLAMVQVTVVVDGDTIPSPAASDG
ncbi:hypothetical protein NDU88_006560 [Pleurodeles waltl]|uniref:Uncharacterized protein n=1 Tax=Pleurodeles waltl TaxID=8319 RepID=A0AAV7QI00_PLEWA|nr:hypothetical protein NDU88_006560 [Pleurodeles waltl]